MKSFIRITASLLAALTVLLSFNTAAYALGIEDAYHHGDVTLDNKIDVTDATAIQKYAVALAEFSPEQLSKADVNYDGVINVADATLIQKIASGLYIPLAGKKGVDISSHNGDIDIKKIRDAGSRQRPATRRSSSGSGARRLTSASRSMPRASRRA